MEATKLMASITKLIPGNLRAMLKVYLFGMAVFSLFRIVLCVSAPDSAGVPFPVLLDSFLMGLRFDTAVSGYIAIFPFLISYAIELIPLRPKAWKNALFAYWMLAYSAAFALSAADIPYFKYFNSRLGVGVLNWMGSPKIVFEMLVSSPSYYPFIGLFCALCVATYFLLRRIVRSWHESSSANAPSPGFWRLKSIPVFVIFSILIFLGIRGRVEQKSVLSIGTAFTSNYSFANHLGLNPVFTFFKGLEDRNRNSSSRRNFYDEAAAESSVRRLLGTADNGSPSPVLRVVAPSANPQKMNVVIVVMESMSYGYMGASGNFTPTLTPFLDSLARNSVFFENVYSAGIHTFSGIWAISHAMPTVPAEGNPMQDMENMIPFSGLATVLRQQGYTTLFACPHDAQFDNIAGTLVQNGYESIVSQSDYFEGLVTSPWGIDDHSFFERSLPKLNLTAATGKPFLATLLTTTNHGPWALPDPLPPGCSIHSENEIHRAVEFSDWAIRDFIAEASRQPWYENTVFVFVADHGAKINPVYELDLNYNHIPLIFFSPRAGFPRESSRAMGIQADLFPTLMGLLGMGYTNNTLAIDLRRESRPFAFFTADTKFGVIGEDYYYQELSPEMRGLYAYRNSSRANEIESRAQLADSMAIYARTNFEVLNTMIKRKLVSLGQ